MEIYGNPTSFNLENVLKQNIVAHDYYRNDCTRLTSWQAVVDEIYDAVDNVEPWLGGNARGPSTAFCLLHRLFTLRMSLEDITSTINHADSPYIRAVRARGRGTGWGGAWAQGGRWRWLLGPGRGAAGLWGS